MISFLEGRVLMRGGNFVIVDVGGIGYKVFVPPSVLRQAKKEGKIKLFTHLYVRENALELYGFTEYPELEFFELVIQISGVGPKTGLGILGVASLDNLKKAIAAGETVYLIKVSGIGRKTAEKIILELKDKMGWPEGLVSDFGKEEVDVLEALRSLGYSLSEAREALRQLPKETQGAKNRLKQALKILGKK